MPNTSRLIRWLAEAWLDRALDVYGFFDRWRDGCRKPSDLEAAHAVVDRHASHVPPYNHIPVHAARLEMMYELNALYQMKGSRNQIRWRERTLKVLLKHPDFLFR